MMEFFINLGYLFLGWIIFVLITEYLPETLFDEKQLFPIDEEPYLNTSILYVIFLTQAWQTWGTFQYLSWGTFIGWWIGVGVTAFIIELVVEQIRWNIWYKD